ncbi:MAG TPA: tRNA (adenosine(37)-N6)-dimethylallyltransferase MiaA [Nitrospira sp.]|nr:tRNA (adenosine(37)-N6)-dimethylallyltransferase MiaA [Nitrospira sp.]
MTVCSLHTMASLTEAQVRRKPLVVMLGPTAVGKSRVAIEVAKRLETDILTADSRQVYRGMDVGTDKPPLAERQGIVHHLVDVVDPDESFNAGRFRQHATQLIEALHQRRRLPLVVGGTGLYVRILLQGLCEAPPSDPRLRATLDKEAREQGQDRLFARLVAADPLTAAKLHPRDASKIIRALEVYLLSGVPISSFQAGHGFAERPFSALIIGLNRERQQLYQRVEERIDWQLANGLVDETRALLAQGYPRNAAALTGLGYRHVAAYLAGEYDRQEMVRSFKRDTRRFAKRQMTWFRRQEGTIWLMIGEHESVERTAARVMQHIDAFLPTLEATEGMAASPEAQQGD